MKYYSLLQSSLLAFFLLFSFSAHAEDFTNCVTSNNNYQFDTVDLYNQYGTGQIDCVTSSEFQNYRTWDYAILGDRSEIWFTNGFDSGIFGNEYYQVYIFDAAGNYITNLPYNQLALSDLPDDELVFQVVAAGYVNQPYAWYSKMFIKSQASGEWAFYDTISDVPTNETPLLDKGIGSLNFGLAIVVALLSFHFIYVVFNMFTKRKKMWQN